MPDRDLPTPASSLTQAIYERLRAEVLSCRLRPGQKVVIGDLCKVHEVSLGAVREALSRLTSEGLVIAEPQRGFRVAPVSEGDLRQLTEARLDVEGLCLRRAIATGTIAWEARLVAAFHELSRTPERVSDDPDRLSEAWAQAHARYHQALVDGCDNAWLLKLRAILYAQSERYRRLSVPLGRDGRDLDREHGEMVDAMLARDADRACALLDRHLSATTLILLDSGTVQRVTLEPAAA